MKVCNYDYGDAVEMLNYFESESFEKLDISDRKFEGYEFVDCKFNGCNFIDIKLSGCSFLDCTFEFCHMSVVEPHMTRIRSSVFDGCFIQGVNWREYFGTSKFLPFDSFKNCKLKYNIFADIRLSGFDFSTNDIQETTFRDCNLKGAVFGGCMLDNAEFYTCDLCGADFRGAIGYRIDITTNKLKNARFSFPEAMNLLGGLGIKIE